MAVGFEASLYVGITTYCGLDLAIPKKAYKSFYSDLDLAMRKATYTLANRRTEE